jgi:Xaa-Pro aminopeptidase
MEPIHDPEVLARMRVTFDLYQTAVDMMRQNLRRRHPDASEAEIARRMQEWMLEQPEDPPGTPLRATDTVRRHD